MENDEYFMLTYGDGVSDVQIDKILEFHKNSKVTGTITGIRASSKYGQVKTDDSGIAVHFAQYPLLDDRINGGFMVLNREFLDHPMLFENRPIEDAVEDFIKLRKIAVYFHDGFWHCMDTPQHHEQLNSIWNKGEVPWKTWQ